MNPLTLPSLTKHVTDHAGIFSIEQVESLSQIFATHEFNTTEQLLTVLIPHREGNELLDIGLKLFNENKIGQKDLNNGLLLIVSTEEKKLRIITGKGMEIKYSEMVCREIVEKYLRPLLNEGRYVKLIDTWFQIISHTMIINTPSIIDSTLSVGNIGTRFRRKQVHGISFLGLVVVLFGFMMINGYISGLIGIIIAGAFTFVLYRMRGALGEKIFTISMMYPILLGILSFLAFLTPANCIETSTGYDGAKTYACERNIFGYYQYRYTMHSGGASMSSHSNSNSKSSSHSSYGGGGGSSNGGGYGD